MLIQDPLFDMDDLAREALLATPWAGAPLAYTTGYWTPADLTAAFDRYQAEYGHVRSVPRSHMWHTDTTRTPLVLDAHELHVFTAAAHCSFEDHDHSAHPLPGEHLYQANCPRCPRTSPDTTPHARPISDASPGSRTPTPPSGRSAAHPSSPHATATPTGPSQGAVLSAATTWRHRNEGPAS